MRTVARLFHTQGCEVRSLFLPAGAPHPTEDLSSALQGAEAMILPLPASRDGIYPTAEAGLPVPRLSEILSRAEDECLLLGGMLSPTLLAAVKEAEIEAVDYYESETLLEKNAALTAEAAIAMTILDLPVSLHGAHLAIIGAGRIARHLIRLLTPFAPKLLVYARRAAAREEASAAGAVTFPICEGEPLLLPSTVQAVFCTVPALLFDRKAIAALPPGLLFYDLGGGGIDREAAIEHGILLPAVAGLPGKVSPQSAGEYLYDEIRNILAWKRGLK